MKKMVFLAGLVFLLVSYSQAAEAEENLVKNPGFEASTEKVLNWNIDGRWYEKPEGSGISETTIDTTVSHNGKNSLRIKGDNNRNFVMQNVPVERDTTYRVTVWMKTLNLNTKARVKIEQITRLPDDKLSYLTLQEQPLPEHQIGISSGTKDWGKFSVEVKATPETDIFKIQIITNSANTGTVWFDDVCVERKNDEQYVGYDETGDINVRFEERELKAAYVKTGPDIDGNLKDNCWKKAFKAEEFVTLKGTPAQKKTFFYACYDDNYLYLGFECIQNTEGMRTQSRGRDGNAWKDDCIEIFMDTNLDKKTYYQFLFNSKGIVFDGKGYDTLWDGIWQVKTKVEKERWLAEAAIPFASLELFEDTKQTWGFNICRKNTIDNEYSRWVNVGRSSHAPSRFGLLLMPKADFLSFGKCTASSSAELIDDNNGRVLIDVKNMTETSPLKVSGKIIKPNGRVEKFSKTVAAKKGVEEPINIEYRVNSSGKYFLEMEIYDQMGKRPLFLARRFLQDVSRNYVPILAKGKGYCLWYEGSTRKVFKETLIVPKNENPIPEIKISAARGEYEPFQVVIRPDKGKVLKNISFEFSNLISKDGKTCIDRSNITYNPIGYVNIEKPGDIWSHKGDWPDILLSKKIFNADKNENYPVWATVYIPQGTLPGNYNGVIKVKSAEDVLASVKLLVNVWNFSLPEAPADFHFNAMFGLRLINFNDTGSNRYKEEDALEIQKKFIINYVKHHCQVRGSAWAIDSSRFRKKSCFDFIIDQRATKYWEIQNFTHKIKDVVIEKKDGEPKFVKWKNLTAEQFKSRIKARIGWLKSKGISKIYSFTSHERKPEYYDWTKAFANLIKEIDPSIPQVASNGYASCSILPDPELYPYINEWWCALDGFDVKRAKECQLRGDTIIFNTTQGQRYPYPNFVIDTPAINQRIIFWMGWKYGAKGYLLWAVNYWGDAGKGLWGEDWARELFSGEDYAREWAKKFNGEGMLLYPGKDGPINSIRWELIREGIEDVEYHYILREAVNRLATSKAAVLNKGLIREAKELLRICDTFVESTSEYTQDPNEIYEARRKIGETIDKINQVLLR